jgi:hypothetical protein
MKPLLTFLLISTPLLLSCADPSRSAEPAPTILAQWSGGHGGDPQPSTRVVRTVEDWRALWQQVGRDSPRSLEVGREMGLVVFLGERTTGGHSVAFTGVRIQDGRFVAEYRGTAPAPDALTTQALTYPWAFAVVPRSDLPVQWVNATPSSGGVGSSAPPPPRTGTRQER